VCLNEYRNRSFRKSPFFRTYASFSERRLTEKDCMNYIRRFSISTLIVTTLWMITNFIYFLKYVSGTSDEGIEWGFPFHLAQSETFNNPPHYLWPGLTVDIAVLMITAAVAVVVWNWLGARNLS